MLIVPIHEHGKSLHFLWVPSSMVCIFSYWGYSHPLFFASYLILFEAMVLLFSNILSQSVHCGCTERVLIFITWFCILTICWCCLWCLGGFWWIFPCLLGVTSRCIQKGIVWLLPYLFIFLSFFSSCLIALLGIPRLCWIRVERVGLIVLFLTLGEILSVFSYYVWCWL
jgi:hypothetical protein